MFEKEIAIPVKNAELSGTFCLPERHGVFPVVLMVHGSGRLDRNENTKGLKLDVFNTFAHYKSGHFDLVDDAMVCLEYLSRNKQCDNNSIFLLGHSEGSIIVPQMSQKHLQVAGIILLAPFIEKMESILMRQAAAIKDAARNLTGMKKIFVITFFKIFDPVKSQKKLINKVNNTTKDVDFSMLQKVPAKWLKELLAVDALGIYKKTVCPCLVIGGSKDIQCNTDDVSEISNIIQGTVESHIIKDMSHILRLETNKPSVFNYATLVRKPIEPVVLEIVYNWILNETSEKRNS